MAAKSDEENPRYNNENYKYLGKITKEKNKFYFEPFLIDLGNDRDNINDVSWLIYNKKTEPEINHSYFLKEGDIIKMGNVIFRIKMIQINENENVPKRNKNETENSNNNNTLIISGSANNSLELNNCNIKDINIASKRINIKRNSNSHSEKKEKLNFGGRSSTSRLPKNGKGKNFLKNKNKICRICYQEEDDDLLNPLIRPCKCSGSMKYIHLKCLLHWLKSRTANSPFINSNENFNAYYINQKTECELCKQLFPDYIKHNNINYCLIDFDYAQEYKIKTNNNNNKNYINTNMDINANNNNNNDNNNNENQNNFIVIDTVFPLTDNNKYRYIVKFNNDNQIKIGRSLDNQLILNEITVSRNHCLLKLEKNNYGNYEIEMEDQRSKFGCLILLQSNKVEIIKGKPLHIQISNVHLIIQYKKNNFLLSCCNVEVVDEKNSYEKINYKAVKNKNVVKILTEVESDDEGDNDNKSRIEKDSKKYSNETRKELKIEKNLDHKMILSLNNISNSNLNNQKNNENMNTDPKETNEKKDVNEIKENKTEEDKNINIDEENIKKNKDKDINNDNNIEVDNKNQNNKEEINDSVQIEEEKEKDNDKSY